MHFADTSENSEFTFYTCFNIFIWLSLLLLLVLLLLHLISVKFLDTSEISHLLFGQCLSWHLGWLKLFAVWHLQSHIDFDFYFLKSNTFIYLYVQKLEKVFNTCDTWVCWSCLLSHISKVIRKPDWDKRATLILISTIAIVFCHRGI